MYSWIYFVEKVFRTLSWCDFLWVAREANRAVQKQSKMTMLDRTWQGTHTFKAQHKCKPERHFLSAQKPWCILGSSILPGQMITLDMCRMIVKSGILTPSWDLVCRLPPPQSHPWDLCEMCCPNIFRWSYQSRIIAQAWAKRAIRE